MREMKVRVWDDVLKEMLYSRVEQFDDMLGFRFEKHLETENPIYMWSTGLPDKNGKEIYEGDIVTRGDGNFKVIYKQDRHYIGWVATDRNEASYIHIWYDGLEVIGNIHENPHLLKGEDNA